MTVMSTTELLTELQRIMVDQPGTNAGPALATLLRDRFPPNVHTVVQTLVPRALSAELPTDREFLRGLDSLRLWPVWANHLGLDPAGNAPPTDD